LSGIAAPSANRFGRLSPTDAAHVREELGDAVRVIVDGGRCPVGIESTIVDLTVPAGQAPRLLRPGRLSSEAIARVLGVKPTGPAATDVTTPRVSGSLAAHYAPQTPLQIVAGERLPHTLHALLEERKRCAVLCRQPQFAAPASVAQRVLPDEPVGYAYGLYAALRELDGSGVDRILVEAIPAGADWLAIADRLRRAEYGSAAPITSRDSE
ncbi:MAG TPA: Sua5 family C-terminal domain-containing protein, partial [Accumulibacter sp.]|nr:Sua5 family C-terminal domain-containing protein [Accumulibacter sp.]